MEETKNVVIQAENLNLSIGQLLIIKGTEASFYIPPTGVEVLTDEKSAAGLPRLDG